MSIKEKMGANFRTIEGGLFSKVAKADVGNAFAELEKQGITMLGWADPFYPDPALPDHIKKATVEAIETGFPCHYTMPIGNMELKKIIAARLGRKYGLKVDPARNILITPGSDVGLFYSMFPFIEPGDEVLIPVPSYPNNVQDVLTQGGIVVPVPLKEEDNFQLVVEEFEKRRTDRTKLVVLTNPNNPTSTVFRRENMEKLAEWIVKNDLVCIVDQAFEDMVYDGIEMVSMASLPGMWERTVSVFSISKGMALSGYRVGYLVADDVVMDVLYGAAVSVIGATNTAAQCGAIAALSYPEFMEGYIEEYDRRRKKVYEIIEDTPGVSMLMPESAFLSWIRVSDLGDSSEICEYLLREAKVSVNDGKAYGGNGNEYIRVVHGCLKDENKVYDAFYRMSRAFAKLAKEKGIVE
jgi:aspartate/methionine/tyrosine aminotransferase